MKRTLRALLALALCLMVLSPIAAFAKSYAPFMTDFSIDIDDSFWYVFTRDNIANNAELEELGMSYDEMSDFFTDNDAYLDALLSYGAEDHLELVIVKRLSSDGFSQLSDCTDAEVKSFAKGGAENFDTDDYSVYKTRYKFARLEYCDEDGTYACRFVTIVNNYVYSFDFTSPKPMSSEKYEEIEKIVESIEFEVDSTIKNTYDDDDTSDIVVPVVAAGVVGGISAFVRGKKNKKQQNNEQPPTNSPEING